MKTAIFLFLSSLLLSSLFLRGDQKNGKFHWIFSTEKSCEFFRDDDEYPEHIKSCKEYYREVGYDAESGTNVPEKAMMWTDGKYREVHYIPRVGMLGVSTFTIGEIYDNEYNGGKKMKNAVSYSKDRESITIGVPNDGYIFHVNPADYK